VLAVLVSLLDPGLTIFPTHRLLERVNGPAPTHEGVQAALRELERQPADEASGVLYRRDGRIALLHGETGQLDVELVEALKPEGVSYTASLDDAISAVDRGDAEG